MADLRHIENWVFDLDNTLYSADCQLFAQIDARMTAFIEDRFSLGHGAARKLQKDYYVQYGTTMSGLMSEHDICPEEFMAYVHDIDLSPVTENPALRLAIQKLPGRKFIYTNGSERHAENVSRALGVESLFDGVFDIKAAAWTPKPHRQSYEIFLREHAVDPSTAIMFEDIAQNLLTPHEIGMTTVLVCSDAAWLDDEPHEKRPAQPGDAGAHIHHVTEDLTDFLRKAECSSSPAEADKP